MALRSMLFVPADSDRKLHNALHSAADALIIDLEDSVAPTRKPLARVAAAQYIEAQAARCAAQLYVRINPLDGALALGDLAAVVVPGLAGVMLPKIYSAADVQRLGYYLDALEARAGMAPGSVRIVPVATETPAAMVSMGSFAATALPRLAGITWGAEDLSTAIGAISNRDSDGGPLSPLYELAGAMCLCAASAAGVPAIDTLYADFRDAAGLAAACGLSRRRGFSGRIAIHPDQVDTINSAFSPSAQERERAQRILDAFAAQPEAGTVSLDGVMLDIPHLKQAQKTLGLKA